MSSYLTETFLDQYADFPKYSNILGMFVYLRCVSIDTKILCDDLVWRCAGDLVEGQGIIGFDEFPTDNGRRYIRTGYVTANAIKKSPVVGVELEDGTIVYATKNHPWLVKIGTDTQYQWRFSEDLVSSDRGKEVYLVRPLGKPWETDTSYEAGYLAAAFDGEGSLDRLNGVAFVQIENAMLSRVEAYLTQYAIPYSKRIKINYSDIGKQDCYQLTVYGKERLFNLLGRIQTARIQHKFVNKLTELSDTDTGMQLWTSNENLIKVVNVFDAGERDIAVLSTSIGTHFTDGFASHNTYSRWLGNRWETWKDTVQRVVDYSMSLYQGPQNDHRQEAEELFDAMFHMRVFPSGRTLWIGGTKAAALHPLANFNCSFAVINSFDKFVEGMYLLLCGAGFGFRILPEDVQHLAPINTNIVIANKPYNPKAPEDRREDTVAFEGDNTYLIVVGDSKTGWTDALRLYFEAMQRTDIESVIFNYDSVRPEGEPLKTFGGYASGHGALRDMFKRIHAIIRAGNNNLTALQCMDIMNVIGMAIVVGGTRRTAEIALFDIDDTATLTAKEYLWTEGSKNYPARYWRGASNNSILFKERPTKETLAKIFESINVSAEPGFVNWEAMQKRRVYANGANPCLEILLDDRGVCKIIAA